MGGVYVWMKVYELMVDWHMIRIILASGENRRSLVENGKTDKDIDELSNIPNLHTTFPSQLAAWVM